MAWSFVSFADGECSHRFETAHLNLSANFVHPNCLYFEYFELLLCRRHFHVVVMRSWMRFLPVATFYSSALEVKSFWETKGRYVVAVMFSVEILADFLLELLVHFLLALLDRFSMAQAF